MAILECHKHQLIKNSDATFGFATLDPSDFHDDTAVHLSKSCKIASMLQRFCRCNHIRLLGSGNQAF